MKFIKIVLIGIAVIVGLIVLVVVNMGYSLFQLGDAVVEQANQPVAQKIQKSDTGVIVTVALHEKKGIEYESVPLCVPVGHEDDLNFEKVVLPDGFSLGYSCGNGLCSIWIKGDQKVVPKYISMYVLDNAICEQKPFETKGHVKIMEYEATIEFTDELLQALDITSTPYKVGATHSNGVSTWQIMGSKKSSFSYERRYDGDELSIDGIVKAHMIYK